MEPPPDIVDLTDDEPLERVTADLVADEVVLRTEVLPVVAL